MIDRATPQLRFAVGSQVRVTLLKPGRHNLHYPVHVLADDGVHIVAQGRWAEIAARDIGVTRFEPGDLFTEHYWRDRQYSIKQVHSAAGALNGGTAGHCGAEAPGRRALPGLPSRL